jgi:hypothetical protein
VNLSQLLAILIRMFLRRATRSSEHQQDSRDEFVRVQRLLRPGVSQADSNHTESDDHIANGLAAASLRPALTGYGPTNDQFTRTSHSEPRRSTEISDSNSVGFVNRRRATVAGDERR